MAKARERESGEVRAKTGERSPRKGGAKPAGRSSKTVKVSAAAEGRPRLLAGGNPQIAKGYGDAPVRAYIAAMSGGGPGWKREVGKRLDAIIVSAVPGVRKAVKYNSPLYGAAGDDGGWFLGIHCFAKYVKVAFFRGASLRPVPPGTSKQKDVRYLDIYEGKWGGAADETQFADWVRQASELPGERM